MEEEATVNTGGEAAVDTSNTGRDAGVVTDEAGGVSDEEIASALGPRYKTVAPAKEAAAEEPVAELEAAEEEEVADEETPAKPTPEKPAAPVTASDGPDFSFQVEDANGVTYKIAPGDSIEDVLKDFDPKNNGQIIAILEQVREAKDSQAKHVQEQEQAATTAAQAERVATIQQGWDEEIKSLQADKRLPLTAKGAENERVAEVFKYMAEENDKRMQAGRPTIGSFEDGLDKLENQEARAAKVEAAKAEKETARKNGALVGGSSAANTTTAPAYVAGSARNVNQALRAQGLL